MVSKAFLTISHRGSFLVCLWAGNVILSFMLELSIHWILISIGSRSWWNLWCEFHIRLCFSPSTQCDTLFPIYQASLSCVGDGWYASEKWTKWYNTYDDDRDHICTFYEWRIFFYNPKIHPSRKKSVINVNTEKLKKKYVTTTMWW